tara:strand:- start:27947 stop:28681 length:735 start_codon:yes stop_codon:yes gene_type:complete
MIKEDNILTKSTRMMKRLLNMYAPVQSNFHKLDNITTKINNILEYEISQELTMEIISSWHFHQVLINMSNKTETKKIKKKLHKAITLLNELKQDIYNDDLKFFDNNFSSHFFEVPQEIIKLYELLNKKKGSSFNKEYIIKKAYFELLFIAELLGLKQPNNYYEPSKLKSFLRTITIAADNMSDKEDKSLQYYCQEYNKTKSNETIKYKIQTLIDKNISYKSDVYVFKELLIIYQDKIAPIMLET